MLARTTLNQLTNSDNGMGRLKAMPGAKNFVRGSEPNGDEYVSFRFPRGAKNKANYIKIVLNASDTYTVEFGKVHGMNYKVISNTEGLYNDMLYNHFTSETALALKLF